MQQKVQRVQIRNLESLDRTRDNAAKMRTDSIHSDVSLKYGKPFSLERDKSDVCRISFVARTGMRDVDQPNPHPSTSTVVCTTVLSISAGQ